MLPDLREQQFVPLACEKRDDVRFLGLARLAPLAVVVADNVISLELADCIVQVRSLPGADSVTLPIGKGLEVTCLGR